MLKPVWHHHIGLPCYPIAVMEILDESGEYRPDATLKLQGDPLKPHMPLHFRVDYTLIIPGHRSIMDRLFRRRGLHLAMEHLRGHDSAALTEMAARSLGEIIYLGVNRARHHAMEKSRIWPSKRPPKNP